MNEKIKDKNDAQVFTLSAVVVGFLLLQELDLNEQNDLGNWFLLLGQLLCTNAARLSVLQTTDSLSINTSNDNQDMSDMLEKTVKAMQQEINELKGQVEYLFCLEEM